MTRHHAARRTPDLRITGPAALIEAVPYLLGFRPLDSLVLVGLDSGNLVVTARIDLADVADPTLLADTFAAMVRGGASAAVVLVYDDTSDPPAPDPAPPEAGRQALIEAAAARAGCAVLDVLLVARGRWWSYSCGSAQCCPAGGAELPDQPSAVSAAATFAGLVALPDRAALVASLDPYPDARRELIRPLIDAAEHAAEDAGLAGDNQRHDRSVKRALFTAARAADDIKGGWTLSDPQAARFGVALRGIDQRDAVWMAIEDGRLDGHALWRELSRRLPGPYDAAPLFLFGWWAWRAGNGALAGIAVERAVRSDPGYSAADLLGAALARGLDPRRLPRLRLKRSA